jgi:arylsulfatase A-like enzyme
VRNPSLAEREQSATTAGVSSPSHAFRSASISTLLLVALWFAIVAGYVEGLGLLIFQHLNSGSWGRGMHVAKEILWISPLVDIGFFLAITLLIAGVSRFSTRIPALGILVFSLGFLTAYDWLALTHRLDRRASVLLGLGLASVVFRWVGKHEPTAIRAWKRSTPWLLASLPLLIVIMETGIRAHEAYATAKLPPAKPNSPNILVVVLDTLRADHLSCYGYPRATSPEITQLAQQGVLFENAIAPSSWSLPSHASLLTGQPVHEHGWGNTKPMPWLGWGDSTLNGLPTLGEALQQRGYRTAAISANSVYFTKGVGLGRGFLHFEDYFENAGDGFVRTLFGSEFSQRYMHRSRKSAFSRGFRALGLGRWLDEDAEGSGGVGGTFGVRKRADEVNSETLHWIQSQPKRPFFAFLNYFDVHFPYGGPDDYPKPAWDSGSAIDEYDAGLRYDDDYLGRLLHQLDARGILKNTIVVLTSDHGESLGDHGLSEHGAALYWELIHVPLIIYYPGHIPEGVRIQQPVSNEAIANTVMDLIGEHTNVFPGPSLAELWQAPAPQWPDPVSELPKVNNLMGVDKAIRKKEPLSLDGNMRSVVSSRWELIQHEKRADQIYDWRADPRELKDLINTPEGTAARAEILGRSR